MVENGGSRRNKRQEPVRKNVGLEDHDDQFVVRSLSRGLRVLALFSIDYPEWGLSDLARATGLHKATTYRMTRTMEAEGFLIFDATTGNYHLGPSAIPMSYLAQKSSEFEKMGKPFLEALAAETGETANLGIEIEGSFVIIGSVLTSHAFKPSLPIGRVLTDLANSHAKVFVAFKPPAERARFLAKEQVRFTQYTLLSPVEIEAELDRVVGEGVAYDLEEHGAGVCSAAAPVRGQNGAIMATLSVVAPKERFGPEEQKRIAEAVKRVAADFSAFMGYVSK
jgi:DNA-binding IclR family transcriptional regulator